MNFSSRELCRSSTLSVEVFSAQRVSITLESFSECTFTRPMYWLRTNSGTVVLRTTHTQSERVHAIGIGTSSILDV